MAKLQLPDLAMVREIREAKLDALCAAERASVMGWLNRELAALSQKTPPDELLVVMEVCVDKCPNYMRWLPRLAKEIGDPWEAHIIGFKKNELAVFPVDEECNGIGDSPLQQVFREINQATGSAFKRGREERKAKRRAELARKRKHEEEDEDVEEIEPSAAAAAAGKRPKQESESCTVCMDTIANTIAMPCGHQVVCRACSNKLKGTADAQTCVRCRAKVEYVLEVL